MTAPHHRVIAALLCACLLPAALRADFVVLGELMGMSSDYTIRRFDERTGAYVGDSSGFNEGWTAVTPAPGGHFFAASNVLGSGIIQDFAADGSLVREVCSMGVVTGLTFGPDGNLYAAGSLGFHAETPQMGVVKFDPRDGRALGTFIVSGDSYESTFTAPCFGPDGHFYAIAASGIVRHDGQTGAPMGIFVPLGRGGLAEPTGMRFGPGGHLYVTSRSGNSVLQFNGATGAFMRALVPAGSGGLSQPTDLVFTERGLFVTSKGTNQILRYAADTGAFLGPTNGGGMIDGPNHLAATGAHSSTDVDWFDDALPPGATGSATGGDSWNWVSTAVGPRGGPVSGRYAHVSADLPGRHEHAFNFAQPFTIGANDILYAYYYSTGRPRQVMLSWNSGKSWEHRAYWGENLINAGVNGTASRYQVSPHVPHSTSHDPGWRRLEVPAAAVGLAGKTVIGMSFTLFDGGGAWDRAGRKVVGAGDTVPPTITVVRPAAGPVSGVVTFEVNATDAGGVRTVEFFVEGESRGVPVSSPPYRTTIDFSGYSTPPGVTLTLSAVATDQAGNTATASVEVSVTSTPPPPTGEEPAGVWFDRGLPEGARPGGDWSWWTGGPYEGAQHHRIRSGLGLQENFFNGAYTGMTVQPGDTLYAYVRIPTEAPPAELMISWLAGNWEHRAYWGANRITYGKDGTASRRHMGPLPATGNWVRLEIPAAAVDLEGRTVTGMSFSRFDGDAQWSAVGRFPAGEPPPPPPPPTGETLTWFDDSFPAGSRGGATGGAWTWMQGTPAAHSGTAALHSTLAAGMHEQYFNFAWEPLAFAAGDKFFIHVHLDPANPPRQLVLSFNADNWEHRAYWGEALLRYGAEGSPAQKRIGDLPATGRWVRLEVPAEAVGLQGLAVKGMSLTLYDGRAVFDQAGRSRPASGP